MSVNASNASATCVSAIDVRFTHTVLPAVFATVFIVGMLSNLWGLRSVCHSWNNIGNINIFMFNLGLADLLYLFTLPFLVDYYIASSRWRYGEFFCKVTRFCFNLNLYCSIGFLTCISLYRYFGIVHPMWAMGKITSCHSLVLSALVWLLVFVQILPDMFFDKNDPGAGKEESCFDTTSDNFVARYLPYSIVWTVTGFVVPLVVILVCYGHVLVVLATKANVNPVLRHRCLTLVATLVILFSVCFVPYHVLRIVNLRTRILKLDGVCRAGFADVYVAHQVGRCLACLNSALNPLIYIVGNDDFLSRLHRLGQRARLSASGLRNTVLYRKATDEEVSLPQTHENSC